MFVATSSAFASGWGGHSQKAVFVQTNNTNANRIIVYDRAWDGTLTRVTSYLTGGMGATASGAPQQTRWHHGLADDRRPRPRALAVNAGSNTVSLFRVRGNHLWLKQVIASGGQFPASIAVHGNWSTS